VYVKDTYGVPLKGFAKEVVTNLKGTSFLGHEPAAVKTAKFWVGDGDNKQKKKQKKKKPVQPRRLNQEAPPLHLRVPQGGGGLSAGIRKYKGSKRRSARRKSNRRRYRKRNISKRKSKQR
jgi:hypothetical protein